jgi:hypothetical protein
MLIKAFVFARAQVKDKDTVSWNLTSTSPEVRYVFLDDDRFKAFDNAVSSCFTVTEFWNHIAWKRSEAQPPVAIIRLPNQFV